MESEASLKRLVENMPVMIHAFDENRNFIAWNRECERMTGYSAQELGDVEHLIEKLGAVRRG